MCAWACVCVSVSSFSFSFLSFFLCCLLGMVFSFSLLDEAVTWSRLLRVLRPYWWRLACLPSKGLKLCLFFSANSTHPAIYPLPQQCPDEPLSLDWTPLTEKRGRDLVNCLGSYNLNLTFCEKMIEMKIIFVYSRLERRALGIRIRTINNS